MALAKSTELAYERAFQTHWGDVFRFALAWTNDWAAAEDLAQEAFLRLWDNRGRLDWDRPVLPWLLVATRRLATDRFRATPAPPVAVADDASRDHGPIGPGALARCLRRDGRPVTAGTCRPRPDRRRRRAI